MGTPGWTCWGHWASSDGTLGTLCQLWGPNTGVLCQGQGEPVLGTLGTLCWGHWGVCAGDIGDPVPGPWGPFAGDMGDPLWLLCPGTMVTLGTHH